MQLLNFEAANQSIFHSLLPIGFGLALLREDSNSVINVSEEDEDSETEEDEVESVRLNDSDRIANDSGNQ